MRRRAARVLSAMVLAMAGAAAFAPGTEAAQDATAQDATVRGATAQGPTAQGAVAPRATVPDRTAPRAEVPAGTSDHTFAPLIPAPVTASPGRGAFELTATTPVVPAPGAEGDGIARYFIDLTSRTSAINLRSSANRSARQAIVFEINPQAPSGEGYSLEVATTGILVRAREPRGLFYGAVSLWQLITANPSAGKTLSLPAMKIEDGPRFAWRGLMLDVARHYMPPDGVKQLIDQMALHKLNTFHWHLTDDQGWRIEIRKHPRLTSVGAWRVPAGAGPASDIDPATGKPRLYGGYYTQQQVRDIVRYAADRFITVVPEIEMPGHAQAAIAAYPQLGTEGATPPVSPDWGVHNYLYNVDESTFTFLEEVLTEVMALFPGQYIHIGGDEAVKDRWRASPRVQQRMRELGVANEAALQSYFTHRMEKFLSAHGRKLIGWDEILEGGLPPAATVMSWRGEAGAIEAVKGGHDVVMAPVPALYLDYLQSDAADEPPGRPRHATLEGTYKFKVVPAAITGEATRHIIGAQINAWTEHMRTPERVHHAIFPRLAAFAETVWSNESNRSWPDFTKRLPAQFARYEKLGVRYADSAYAVQISNTRSVKLSNQLGIGVIRYTLDGSEPTLQSPAYTAPLTFDKPVTLAAATFQGQRRVSSPRRRTIDKAALLRRSSDELRSCSNKLPLRLEDDAPREGTRAVFNVDILDPCWIYERADLERVTAITAAVGQVPFNFQVGDDAKKIPLYAPQSAAGELEIRLDSCEGERIAVMPLAPAVSRHGVTELPATNITARPGTHDLCLRFTRRGIDPIWTIGSVQLIE
jgi:hexosaminidase